jgi:hypothetical protein
MRQKEVGLQYLRTILVTLIHPPARNSSRVGQHLQLALGAAVALAAISLSPGSARAFNVIVGGTQYDVTTFTGSYNDNTSNFATAANSGVMPWWVKSNTAREFGNAVAGGLGGLNLDNRFGPAFAYLAGGGVVNLIILDNVHSSFLFNTNSPQTDTAITCANVAPASSAPVPLTLFGAAAAFGFSRKQSKLAPAALVSGLPLA